jgi:putative tricarboxylic transport membrane protein
MNKDVVSGLALLGLAAAYYWALRQIPDSSLSDEVGAQGLPLILAILLAGLAVAIVLRGLAVSRRRQPATEANADEDETAPPRRALGFVAIAAGYVLVTPLVGFAPALALLIAAVAVFEGTRPSWRVAAVAVAGAFAFWLLFVQILGVEQPRSVFF